MGTRCCPRCSWRCCDCSRRLGWLSDHSQRVGPAAPDPAPQRGCISDDGVLQYVDGELPVCARRHIEEHSAAAPAVWVHPSAAVPSAVASARETAEAISTEFRIGEHACNTLWSRASSGDLDFSAEYPATHRGLDDVFRLAVGPAKSVSYMFTATEKGRFAGMRRGDNGVLTLRVGVPPTVCPDDPNCGQFSEVLYCRNNARVDLCQHKACKGADGQCTFCQTREGEVVNATCGDCVPCDGWRGGFVEDFSVPQRWQEWDLPYTAGRVAGYCAEASGASWESGAAEVQGTTAGGQSGRVWVGGPRHAGKLNCSVRYEPRMRPWYVRTEQITWSPVHTETEGMPDVYLAATRAVRNPAFDGSVYIGGSPEDPSRNPWLGVVGVSFEFGVVSQTLRRAKPTPNSVMLLCDADGSLVSASIRESDLLMRTHGSHGHTGYHIVNVLQASDWQRQDLVDVYPSIVRRHGTLFDAMESEPNVFRGHHGMIISYPIRLGELRLLLAGLTPYGDSLSEIDDGSVLALAFALCYSVAFGSLLTVLVAHFLAPLRRLCVTAIKVAGMELEGLTYPRTIVEEIVTITGSFRALVEHLKFYKEFMPQSVLVGADNEYDRGESENEVMTLPQDGPAQPISPTTVGTPFVPGQKGPNAFFSGILKTGSAVSLQSGRAHSQGSTPQVERDNSDAWRGSIMRGSFQRTSTGNHGLESAVLRMQRTISFADTVTIRRMTLLVTNLSAFQRMSSVVASNTSVSRPFRDAHGSYVSAVVDAVRRPRGITDGFSGDRIYASFNASKNCATHAQGAVTAAKEIQSWSAKTPAASSLKTNCAVASGMCGAGTLGCLGFRKYSILGRPSGIVHVIERLSNRWSVPVLTDRQVRLDVSMFIFRLVAAIVYAKGPPEQAKRTEHVWEVLDEQQSQTEEWMYSVGAAEEKDPFRVHTKAVDALLSGDLVGAATALSEAPPGQAGCEELSRMLEEHGGNPPAHLLLIRIDDIGGAPLVEPFRPTGTAKRPDAGGGLSSCDPKRGPSIAVLPVQKDGSKSPPASPAIPGVPAAASKVDRKDKNSGDAADTGSARSLPGTLPDIPSVSSTPRTVLESHGTSTDLPKVTSGRLPGPDELSAVSRSNTRSLTSSLLGPRIDSEYPNRRESDQ
eukprot:TRINITY_DN20220_c0_g1_i2.p1 TRINITY_DN20220_c0_g1~~TRINITY_DN20220_c0_g1_i2.p1  ORF type:complete len:1141 (+),score=137.57 TRINITY_DN20220_c0_g1_i2:147-3569(+)